MVPSAVASMANPGPHGFTEVLYAYTSQTGNNGSAFAGLTGNTLFYNLTGAIAMLVGRFWMIIPAMAIAGSLAAKKIGAASAGTFPTTGGLFVGLVVGVILIIGGLTFFPALALGPIVEHLAMTAGTLFSCELDSESRRWKPPRCASSMPVSALFDPKIVVPAIGSAFVKLDPRTLMKNPVMFVLEVVTALTTVILIRDLVTGGANHRLRVPDHPVAVVHGAVRQLRRGGRRGPRQGAGRRAAPPAHRDAGQAADRGRTARTTSWCRAPA